MGAPKVFVTGNPAADRQNRELAKSQETYIAELDIAAETPIIKTIRHRLGRTPRGWRLVRQQIGEGATGNVQEVTGGKWGRDEVELQFPGGGLYSVEFF